MAESTAAWLLKVSDTIQFCIAEYEAEAYIDVISLKSVPLSPTYCNQVIFWNELILPVIDMSRFQTDKMERTSTNSSKHIFIVSYQQQENKPLEYIAFKLCSSPLKIVINDDDICKLPDEYPDALKSYLLSVFNHNNEITSVFDIARLSAG
jgi:chemotaxis signal transduction protein